MLTTGLSALFEFNRFTGFEHTRVVAMLTMLAIISVFVWASIGLSIIIRQVAVASIRRSRHNFQASANMNEGNNGR